MGLDNSQVMCCIDGCESLGAHVDPLSNRLYCEYHWQEECRHCNAPPCDQPGCADAGLVTQHGTNNHWCTKHAWRRDRMEQGLRHPSSFTDDDMDFLKTLAIRLDGDNRDKENNNG